MVGDAGATRGRCGPRAAFRPLPPRTSSSDTTAGGELPRRWRRPFRTRCKRVRDVPDKKGAARRRPLLRTDEKNCRQNLLMRFHASGLRRLAVIVRRLRDRRSPVARRDELDQVIDELIGLRGAETGRGIPARSGVESLHAEGRVVAARHVVEGRGVVGRSLTDVVESFIDEAEVISGLLVRQSR